MSKNFYCESESLNDATLRKF